MSRRARPDPVARDNLLIVHGPHLPGGEIRINYLEAFCRASSTETDWGDHTVIPHATADDLVLAATQGDEAEIHIGKTA